MLHAPQFLHPAFPTLCIFDTSYFLRKILDYFAQGCPFRFNENSEQIFNLVCSQSRWAPERVLFNTFRCSSTGIWRSVIPAKQFCAFLVVLYSFITLWSSVNIVYDLPGTIAKTRFRIIGSRQQLAKINVDSTTADYDLIRAVTSVRNLGTWFDQHVLMSEYIGKMCNKAFYSHYNIRQIRKYLTDDTRKILLYALVMCHSDYCNGIFCTKLLNTSIIYKQFSNATQLRVLSTI